MKLKIIIFCFCFLLFAFYFDCKGQYDFVVKSLSIHSEVVPISLEGDFVKVTEIQAGNEIVLYSFSNPRYDFCYYPKQSGIDCGYFSIDTHLLYVADKYPHDLGCDLDYGSFELSNLKIGEKEYLILSSIRYGSGTTTRYVCCNLFDITIKDEIQFFPLWSMYGSSSCFGDYNADGKLDFLQIRYDPKSKDNDIYRLTFSTLDGKGFRIDEDKYIVFKREYQDKGLPKIISIEEKW